MSNSLDSYLVLSGLLFAIGSFGFLARRNAISMLMSIELMLNAVNLAIVVAVTVTATDWGAVTSRLRTATDALARLLFSDFVLPFEIVSVLLLAAVIGGVFLAKREEGGP